MASEGLFVTADRMIRDCKMVGAISFSSSSGGTFFFECLYKRNVLLVIVTLEVSTQFMLIFIASTTSNKNVFTPKKRYPL